MAADVGQGNEKGCVIDRPLPKKCTVAPKRLAGPLLLQLFKGMLMWLPPAPRTTIWPRIGRQCLLQINSEQAPWGRAVGALLDHVHLVPV